MTLPLINIEPFLRESTLQERLDVAKHLDKVCREIGFFYLIGHGIPETQRQTMHQMAREFFALPDAEKDAISISRTDYARGWQKLGQNITKYAKDWHEGIDYYAPAPHALLDRGMKTLSGSNPWPRNPPRFQSICESYVQDMIRVGEATMRAMALALGLEESYFEPFMNTPFWVMRLIGYPPLQKLDGVGASCGCLTILNTDETTGALQVQNRSGEWITADPVQGAFVINIGDMFSVWTNGIYISTLHRVMHTKESFRTSIPFFYEPNFDAVISPLPKCIQERGSCHYQEILYGDHILGKVSNNFDVSENVKSKV